MEERKQAYLKMLDEAVKVERAYSAKNKERMDAEKYNVTPVAPPERTVEEEQNDLTFQKQRAMDNARTLVKSEVAGEFVSGLGDEDILLFNRYIEDFGKEVKRFKSVDTLFLRALWSRYVEKMGKTYGIDMPLEMSDIERREAKEAEPPSTDSYADFATKMRELNPTMTDRQIRMMYANEFQGKDRAEARAKDLLSRVGEAEARYRNDWDIMEEAVVRIPEEKDKIRFPHENAIRMNQERVELISRDVGHYQSHLAKLLEEREDLLARDAKLRARTDLSAKKKKMKVAEMKALLVDNDIDIDRVRTEIASLKRDRGTLAKDSVAERRARDLALRPLEEREAKLRREPAMRRGVDPREELSTYFPFGLEETRGGPRDEPDQDYRDPRMGFSGYGIRAIPQGPTLVPFGKYLIHRPSLQKRELRVRFRSKVKVPKMPDRPLPVKVAHAIEMALSAGKLTSAMVQGMSQEEKNLLAWIGDFAGIDHPLQNTDKQEELERFELLRGEVCAGNDNPAIVKELKQLVLRFMGDGRLKQMDGQRILAEIATLL